MSRIAELCSRVRSAILSDPARVTTSRAVQRLRDEVLRIVQASGDDELVDLVRVIDHLALDVVDEEGTSDWWSGWQSGQVEALREWAHRELIARRKSSARALLVSRRNVAAILRELPLTAGFRSASELAGALDRDLPQLMREVRALEQHGLVETEKQGQKRLIRMTDHGRWALLTSENQPSPALDTLAPIPDLLVSAPDILTPAEEMLESFRAVHAAAPYFM